MMLNERQTGLGGSTQRLHQKYTTNGRVVADPLKIFRAHVLGALAGLPVKMGGVFLMGAKQDRQVLIRKVENCGLTAL